MELLVPACWKVFSGSLNDGTFSEKNHKFQGGCYPGTEFMVYDVDFSGRNVAVLLNFRQQGECFTDATATGLNSASIRFCRCVDVDTHNHWGRLSLEKLKNDKGITLVDCKPRIVTTVGDIRYQERLDSFFKKDTPNVVVNPLFAEKNRFDPETLASFGWEYAPRDYENTKEAESSWKYFFAQNFAPETIEDILIESTANDAIKSYTQFFYRKIFISEFESNTIFPNGLISPTGLVTPTIGKTSPMYMLVDGIKRNHVSNLLSINNESQKAVVVKLAGCHDYLLTTLEKKDELCFEHFSDHELLSYFRDSWHKHLEEIESREFERDTLPLLGKILPAIDENYQKIADLIEMISSMTDDMVKTLTTNRFSQQSITERMIEFQSLYLELALIQKQIEFYTIVENSTQQKIDGIDGDSWTDHLISSSLKKLNFLVGMYGHQVNIIDNFKEWFKKSNIKEKKKATTRLKSLNRKLFIAKYKINTQSTLEQMLLSLAGKLIDHKYSSSSSSSDECLRNDYRRWFTITNDVLVMIGLNKPDFDRSDNHSSLEPLDLAADLTYLSSGQKDRTLNC